MQTFRLNHIAISVKDVNESVEFYQTVFRFREIKNTASNSKTRWLLIDESRQLHLIPRPDFKIRINKAVHFAFSTSDLDSFISLIDELKIVYSDWIDSPNRDYIRKDKIRQIYIQDPNGFWIEINDDV